MTHHYKVRRHDGVVDALLLAALDSDLVVCREGTKHFQCPYGSGEAITSDGATHITTASMFPQHPANIK